MNGGKRITIRLDEEAWGNVQALCQAYGLDVSAAVRSALRSARASGNCLPAAQAPQTPFSMPNRIVTKSQPYLAWANGNLKNEWSRLRDNFFGMTLAARRLYPRTSEIAECLAHLVNLEQKFPGGTHGV